MEIFLFLENGFCIVDRDFSLVKEIAYINPNVLKVEGHDGTLGDLVVEILVLDRFLSGYWIIGTEGRVDKGFIFIDYFYNVFPNFKDIRTLKEDVSDSLTLYAAVRAGGVNIEPNPVKIVVGG